MFELKEMIYVCALIGLLLTASILIPKMLSAEIAGCRFGLGVVLFGGYTALTLLMFSFFGMFDGAAIRTGEEVFTRIVVAFLLMNIMTLFAACLYFVSREKRKLTQAEKMKLKDL